MQENTTFRKIFHLFTRFGLFLIVLMTVTELNNPSIANARYSEPIPDKATVISDIQTFLYTYRIASVEDYAKWLKTHIVYKSDNGRDFWQDPLKTIHSGAGDCEDMAFLTAEVLKVFGFEPRILAAGTNRKAHVFTAFKRNGVYEIFDNVKYYNPKAPTIEHIFAFLNKTKKAEYLLELQLKPKKSMKALFVNKFEKTS